MAVIPSEARNLNRPRCREGCHSERSEESHLTSLLRGLSFRARRGISPDLVAAMAVIPSEARNLNRPRCRDGCHSERGEESHLTSLLRGLSFRARRGISPDLVAAKAVIPSEARNLTRTKRAKTTASFVFFASFRASRDPNAPLHLDSALTYSSIGDIIVAASGMLQPYVTGQFPDHVVGTTVHKLTSCTCLPSAYLSLICRFSKALDYTKFNGVCASRVSHQRKFAEALSRTEHRSPYRPAPSTSFRAQRGISFAP